MNRYVCLTAAAVGLFTLIGAAVPARAGTLTVDGSDVGCDDVIGTPFCSIDAAAAAAIAGDTVRVAPGTYVENVVIDRDLKLVSTGGRAVTAIEGISGVGALGTVQIEGTTTGVTIGKPGGGFTIIGIDNGLPGIENAAIYVRGNHSNARIRHNEIVANGDSGFTAEFAATLTGTVIKANEFSGQTYLGAEPGDCGFSNQFTAPNVPRQLFVIGGGTGGGNTSDTRFVNNRLSGTAGATSSVAGCTEIGQGNTLATVDSNGATIKGNLFAGQTARFATSLRARGPDTAISRNQFKSSGFIGLACHSFTVETGRTLGRIARSNDYDSDVLFVNLPSDTTGTICAAPDDDDDDDDDDD